MTQKHKELLFIDLCGRLPYKVKMFEIEPINGIQSNLTLQSITNKKSVICITPNGGVVGSSIDAFKPYLFPLSSMTEEQKTFHNFLKHSAYANPIKLIDWYNKNHFDFRGLIPKDLAINAVGLNIYNCNENNL